MTNLLGEAYVRVRPDLDGFARETEKGFATAAKRASVAMAGYFAGSELKSAFDGLTDAAGDLGEAQNATNLIFREGSAEMDAFFATSAEGLGMSERAARQAAVPVASLLNAVGMTREETVQWSQDILTLGADLGSAFNEDPARAVEAIGAAVRGETEPIRRFGVVLDDASVRAKAVEMGLADSAAAVDKNGKAQATLALIMEQTAAVHGDFANTSDSAANAQRILAARAEDAKAALGQALLPALEGTLGAANNALSAFNALPDSIQGTIGAVGMVGGAAALAVPQIRNLSGAMTDLGIGGDKTQRALKGLGKAIGIAGVAYVAGSAIDALVESLGPAAPAVEEVTQALIDLESVSDLTIFEDNVNGVDSFIDAADRLVRKNYVEKIGDGLFGAIGLQTPYLKQAEADINAMDASLAKMVSSGNIDLAEEKHRLLVDALKAEGFTTEQITALFPEYAASLKGIENDQTLARQSAEGLAGALGMTNDEYEDALSNLSALRGEYLSAIETEIAFEAAIDGLSDSLAQNGLSFDKSTEAGRANWQALISSVSGIDEHIAARLREGATLEEVTGIYNGYRDSLINTMVQSGMTKAEAERLVDTILKAPKEYHLEVSESGLTAVADRLDRVRQRILALPDTKTIYLRYKESGSTPMAHRLGVNVARADGGPIVGPGTSRSDSILARLSNGEYVFSARAVQELGGLAAVDALHRAAKSGRLAAFSDGGPVGSLQSQAARLDAPPVAAPLIGGNLIIQSTGDTRSDLQEAMFQLRRVRRGGAHARQW